MLKKISLIVVLLLLLPIQGVFAEAMTYETYRANAAFCDNPSQPWNATNRSVAKIIYPRLEVNAINAWMQAAPDTEASTLGKQTLQEALNSVRIGSLSTLKTLAIVENVYQARMNALFDCAVLESRKNTIERLKNAGSLKGQSEVLGKLDRELIKLNEQYNQCLPNNAQKSTDTLAREVGTRLLNTSIFQYCHYRKYLTYLESNFQYDASNFTNTESKIGIGSGTVISKDSDTFAAELMSRQKQIGDAIQRADRVLPRAIAGYKEMERTYAAHLLLVIIYDDYVHLRDNLNRYMSATTQLFEKANNAMSPK